MDANQIKLFIELNIKSKEPGDNKRLALELDQFTQAITHQVVEQGRTVTAEQIVSAWERWKLERFTYVNNVKKLRTANIGKLEQLVEQRVKSKDGESSDQHLLSLFKQTYARTMSHLPKEPLPEHIDAAWEQWKKNKILH